MLIGIIPFFGNFLSLIVLRISFSIQDFNLSVPLKSLTDTFEILWSFIIRYTLYL
jgi:hypothetical protein